MSRRGLPWMFAALLLLGPGCGGDRLSPNSGSIAGRIMTLDTRAPFAGARVVLFTPTDNTPVGAAATTGSDGRFRFDGLPLGFYYVVIYAGQQIAYGAIEEAVVVRARATTERDVLIASYPLLPDGRIVAGIVTDARTGTPLEGAYVSVGSSDLPLFFGGTGLPWEAVTDRNGRFLLERVPTVTRGVFPVGLTPLVAMKAGYLPGGTGSGRRGEWLPLPADGDTARVVLTLEPGTGALSVSGRVHHEGAPVPGVAVALSFTDTTSMDAIRPSGARGVAQSGLFPRAVAPELVIYSDAGGFFEIRHVAPGHYQLQVAYLPDDGWVQMPEPTGLPEVVVRDRGVTNVSVAVVPGIEYVSPGPGAAVTNGRPRFTWRRVAGADLYYLIFSRANSFILSERIETVDTTALAVPGFWGAGDHARWTVLALREEHIIAAGETIASFSVTVRR